MPVSFYICPHPTSVSAPVQHTLHFISFSLLFSHICPRFLLPSHFNPFTPSLRHSFTIRSQLLSAMAYRGEGNSGDWSLEDYLRRNSDAFAMVMPFQGVALRGEGPENRSRVFLISSGNRNIVVFETGAAETLMVGAESWNGQRVAPAEVINATPTVVFSEATDCVICLELVPVGGEVREMPCGHRFHSHCILRWLGIHGSCPVFRRMIPVDRVTGRRSFLLRVIRREDLGRNPGSLSNLSTDGVNDARGSIVELSWVNDFEPGFTDY